MAVNMRLPLVVALVLAVVTAFGQERRGTQLKGKGAARGEGNPEKEMETERMLLTPPTTPDEGRAFEMEWMSRVALRVAFRLELSSRPSPQPPNLDATLVGLEITNRTPCAIEIVSEDKLRDLQVIGQKKGSPWIAPPNGKLFLAVSKRVLLVALPYGPPGGLVDSLHYGPLFGFKALPNRTTMKPLSLSVVHCYGTQGPRILFCHYRLCVAGKEEAVIKEMTRR